MNLDPSEEQRLLAASIERFVERDYEFEARRRIVASPDGYSQDVWQTLAELGLLGLPLPAAYGGFGGGAMDTVSLMEAIGGALIVEPWLATVALGAQLIARGTTMDTMDRARNCARNCAMSSGSAFCPPSWKGDSSSPSPTPKPLRAIRSRMSLRGRGRMTAAT